MTAKPATVKQRSRFEDIRGLGCLATYKGLVCGAMAEIHHCLTGMGGNKNHDAVAPLCNFHHTGKQGIHTLSRRKWQPIFGYETDILAKVAELLGESAVQERV